MSSHEPNGTPRAFKHMDTSVFARRTAANFATHLLPHLKPHYRILDVGCGPGSITLDLARLAPDGSVLGVDNSPDAISKSRALAQEQKVHNVEFRECNAHNLSDLESESFDVVHSHQLFLYLSDPVAAMKEMRRVVKPGGIVSTRDSARRITTPLSPALAKNTAAFEKLVKAGGGDLDFGDRTHVVAHEAGFEWDQIQMSSWGWEMSGKQGREIWVSGAKDSASAALIKLGIATREECDEFVRGWEEWEKREDARFMGLDGALLCWK